jgi:hypothetical protein
MLAWLRVCHPPAGEPLTIYTAKRGLRVALMEREAAGIADSEDKVRWKAEGACL